jgi:hypothetical protein
MIAVWRFGASLDTPCAAHDHAAHIILAGTCEPMDDQSAMLIVPPAVYIKDTGTPKGRGVFAGRAFKQDEVVEDSPVVPFEPLPDRRLPMDIKRIAFGWGNLLGLQRRRPAIVLGYGSMYNHANPASLRCEANRNHRVLRFIAVRDIAADEELTINYNSISSPVSSNDKWFETNGVTLIADS